MQATVEFFNKPFSHDRKIAPFKGMSFSFQAYFKSFVERFIARLFRFLYLLKRSFLFINSNQKL